MDDKKKAKKVGLNFPCGNVEEMLRMMRKCRERGISDGEKIMQEFLSKDLSRVDYRKIKKRFFKENSKNSKDLKKQ